MGTLTKLFFHQRHLLLVTLTKDMESICEFGATILKGERRVAARRKEIYIMNAITNNHIIKAVLLTAIFFGSLELQGKCETFAFPKGEIPSLSLIQATQICEKIAKKANIKNFNPVQALLYGAKTPKAGAWNFLQYGKNGEIYRFVISFPDDVCILFDEGKPGSQVMAYKHDGTPIKWPPASPTDRAQEMAEPDDP